MFTVMGLMNEKTKELDSLVVNNKKYEWGGFEKGIPPKTLKQIYLDNNLDIDGVFHFIQELAYGGEKDDDKLTVQEIMELRNKNLFILYLMTLIGYLAIYTVEVEDKNFSDYTREELLNLSEKDIFIACILENMLKLFGEIPLSRFFVDYKGTSILTALDSQNRPIYREGSQSIEQEEEMPKWVN